MGLIQDQGVVLIKVTVTFQFREQHPIGEDFYETVLVEAFKKTYLISDRAAQLRTQFLCQARRNTACGNTARLRMTYIPICAPAHFQAHLGELCALARSGGTTNYDHLVRSERGLDLVTMQVDRQIVFEMRYGTKALAPFTAFTRRSDLRLDEYGIF